jgi:hypothetical protein
MASQLLVSIRISMESLCHGAVVANFPHTIGRFAIASYAALNGFRPGTGRAAALLSYGFIVERAHSA